MSTGMITATASITQNNTSGSSADQVTEFSGQSNPTSILPVANNGSTTTPPFQAQGENRKSNRYNNATNLFRPWNHRYRGNREAFKYNLLLQQTLQVIAQETIVLKTQNDLLKTVEYSVYPDSTTMAAYYHSTVQIAFKEFMYLKASDKQWFQ